MSDILSKLQNEANQAQQFADRGQQLIMILIQINL